MKRLLAIGMMILCLLIGFQQALIVLYFNLHQAAIEAEFCVNKNSPALRCQGVCFLKKTLHEVEHREAVANTRFPRFDMLLLRSFEFMPLISSIEMPCRYVRHPENHYIAPFLEVYVPPPIV